MKYVEYLNGRLRAECAKHDMILFGQNIDTGSCLGGLTRDLMPKSGRVINTPNCENALVGFGFGLMLAGRHAVYFVKQLDFLFLAMDQFVNTQNMTRLMDVKGSFTVVTVHDFKEGPQASFAAAGEFLTFVKCGEFDGDFGKPGLRIVSFNKNELGNECWAWKESCS
jgi:pyruvate/2-oxoglutarate/acetoin dehydrogenase E1 component